LPTKQPPGTTHWRGDGEQTELMLRIRAEHPDWTFEQLKLEVLRLRE
jgi:hypothetical protein